MLETGYLKESRTKIAYNKKVLPVLQNSPKLQSIIAHFIECPMRPEQYLEDLEHIGTGNHSIVYSFGAYALKLSTGLTGKLAYEFGTTIPPENLILQSQFLTLLKKYIDKNKITSLNVPNQYIALRSANGNFLSIHENLTNEVSLSEWIITKDLTMHEENTLLDHTKERIVEKLGSFVLKKGLNDLGIKSNGALNCRNIMIPKGDVDPFSADLSIIDQPSKGAVHSIGGILNNMFYLSTKNDFESLEDFLDV